MSTTECFTSKPPLLSRSITSNSRLHATTLDGQTIRGPITPLSNFILVRNKDTLTATEGGILLPDQVKERPTEGEVIAAGPGCINPNTNKLITNPVSAGYNVLYGKFVGTPLEYNEEPVTMIRDDDLLLYYTGNVQMTLENVNPVRDYILVELSKNKMETSSGIVVAETTMRDYEQCEGKVVKCGEGRMSSEGTLCPVPFRVGEMVKFKDYAGNDVRIQGKDYSLVKMTDTLCSFDEE
eukprot:CAMPEP_0195525428 /NCGR_PEP_ID=MMETSP0794_2-20130614/25881_1 /TAXON_ID=515487 /ORGANISM="Stephanopyxis turris, Strain CCMP 815" /LENGTH=237 /DNA_ID=CAMNT_0040655889 /DNA_START=115 /DNA_END=831 /DNA_ORIENTATION=+